MTFLNKMIEITAQKFDLKILIFVWIYYFFNVTINNE